MAMGLDATDVEMRALYLISNRIKYGLPGQEVLNENDIVARALFLYVNEIKHGLENQRVLNANDVVARVLFLYLNRAHDRDPSDVIQRVLFTYAAATDGEIFPWIERIVPAEQYPGGQVSIMGDGFGDDDSDEGSTVRLGIYDPDGPGPGDLMSVVSWQSRSPNLWPANSGVRTTPAIVVTVPPDAESGMVSVEQTI